MQKSCSEMSYRGREDVFERSSELEKFAWSRSRSGRVKAFTVTFGSPPACGPSCFDPGLRHLPPTAHRQWEMTCQSHVILCTFVISQLHRGECSKRHQG